MGRGEKLRNLIIILKSLEFYVQKSQANQVSLHFRIEYFILFMQHLLHSLKMINLIDVNLEQR